MLGIDFAKRSEIQYLAEGFIEEILFIGQGTSDDGERD